MRGVAEQRDPVYSPAPPRRTVVDVSAQNVRLRRQLHQLPDGARPAAEAQSQFSLVAAVLRALAGGRLLRCIPVDTAVQHPPEPELAAVSQAGVGFTLWNSE